MATRPRRAIPVAVRDEVLRESGYMCGNPTCRHILTLELHHVVWVRDGGGNVATNLIALCPNCHSLHTRGHIPDDAIAHWKGILHALNHAFSRESMDLLLYLATPDADQWWISSDGVLKFAGLIAAGFVEVKRTSLGAGARFRNGVPTAPTSTTHQVALSDKGRSLVSAWLSGDATRYRAALQPAGVPKPVS